MKIDGAMSFPESRGETLSSDRKGHEGEKTVSESIRETVKKGQDQSWDRETLEEKVEGMNEFMAKNFRDLEFQIHDQLDRVYVQVMERGTDEIIREVPPEKFLDMVASMMESVGMLVDERL